MSLEIERKFLVRSDAWRGRSPGVSCRQGYLLSSPVATVRVRLLGDAGFLTIKGRTVGISRPEYEYPIPSADARAILDQLCDGGIVEKRRYTIWHGGIKWEIDEFLGDNQGLVLAEVELETESQAVELPEWVGAEVSTDPRYHSSRLAKQPYRRWAQAI